MKFIFTAILEIKIHFKKFLDTKKISFSKPDFYKQIHTNLIHSIFEFFKFNLGESIWDRYIHNKVDEEKVFETGDDACLSYDYPERDVKMLSDLGVSQYRFTFSWPRIVPTGRIQDGVNQAGIRYYSTLINLLIQEKALKIYFNIT